MDDDSRKKGKNTKQEEFENSLLQYELNGYIDKDDLGHPMDFSCDDWIKWVDNNLVHFISKPINSNASNSCVRYNPLNKNIKKLPHLSVRSLLLNNEFVPLDSFGGSHESKYFSELTTTIGISAYVSEDERILDRQRMKDWRYKNAVIKEYKKLGVKIESGLTNPARPVKKMRSKTAPVEFKIENGKEYRVKIHEDISKIDKEFGTDVISPRLRQILIPTSFYEKENNESYISMTPLVSAGLSWVIKDELISRNISLKNLSYEENIFKKVKTISDFGIGGANAQNVSGHAKALNQLILFVDLPQINLEFKKAFSLAYNGFNIKLKYSLMVVFFKKLKKMRGLGLTMSKSIEGTSSELKSLVSELKRDAREYVDAVEKNQEKLISKMSWEDLKDFDDTLTPIDAFWLGVEKSPIFKKDVAEDLVNKISKFSIEFDKESGQKVFISFSKEEKSIMKNLLIGSIL